MEIVLEVPVNNKMPVPEFLNLVTTLFFGILVIVFVTLNVRAMFFPFLSAHVPSVSDCLFQGTLWASTITGAFALACKAMNRI